jgi:hypothetical protein
MSGSIMIGVPDPAYEGSDHAAPVSPISGTEVQIESINTIPY